MINEMGQQLNLHYNVIATWYFNVNSFDYKQLSYLVLQPIIP